MTNTSMCQYVNVANIQKSQYSKPKAVKKIQNYKSASKIVEYMSNIQESKFKTKSYQKITKCPFAFKDRLG